MSLYQINAGPGSGKTTTSVRLGVMLQGGISIPKESTPEQTTIYTTLTKELPQTKNVAYFAHTTTIRDELKARLPPKTPVFTFHGAGLSELIKMYGYQKFDKRVSRIDNFISDITGQHLFRLPYKEMRHWVAVKMIVNLLKQEFMDPTNENLKYLTVKYPDLCLQTIPSDWQVRVEELFRRSLAPNRCVDYSDMTWMAAKLIQRPRYEVGIVDESQDLSACTYQLVNRMCKHILFCGDPNQAIGAFMGADEQMFRRICDKAEVVFPMKVTFRCPPNIITKANRLIPNSVLPGTNKIPGTEKNIGYQSFLEQIAKLSPTYDGGKLNTLVICRTNAPLITLALLMSAKGIPCKLADKDLSGRLIAKVKKLKIKSIDELETALDRYMEGIQMRRNPLLEMIEGDYTAALLQLSAGCTSITQLEGKIKQICDVPASKDAHLLATAHKSKGLEAVHCFIVNPPVEHPLANQNEIAMQQEKHVHFVALTRTKRDLFWVCQ